MPTKEAIAKVAQTVSNGLSEKGKAGKTGEKLEGDAAGAVEIEAGEPLEKLFEDVYGHKDAASKLHPATAAAPSSAVAAAAAVAAATAPIEPNSRQIQNWLQI
jgi:hypothetical protein